MRYILINQLILISIKLISALHTSWLSICFRHFDFLRLLPSHDQFIHLLMVLWRCPSFFVAALPFAAFSPFRILSFALEPVAICSNMGL